LKGSCLTVLLLVPLVACEIDNNDRLAISFGSGDLAPPVQVDTRCENGGCDEREELEAKLYWDADQSVDATTARVEIRQYMIEIRLLGENYADEDLVPPYASVTSVFAVPYEDTTFNVKTIGDVQRDIIRDLAPSNPLDGIGTLTLEGYDNRNIQVTVSTQFDMSFYDFVDEAQTE
jgi:hypothetical protein